MTENEPIDPFDELLKSLNLKEDLNDIAPLFNEMMEMDSLFKETGDSVFGMKANEKALEFDEEFKKITGISFLDL